MTNRCVVGERRPCTSPSGGFERGEAHPLDYGLLVADECSMVDVPLMRALLHALRDRAAGLLVGDVDQLPSVGPGQVLPDVIASGAVPVIRLAEVFRQAAWSRIITPAHRINHGQMSELDAEKGPDFFSCRPRSRKMSCASFWPLCATARRRASASTRCATCRCCAR